ncbi:XRE family transcriptional regulator [Pelagibius sp. Alg239-R121]|uniref:XRE family transcriptional regulator n=1 Tax=Pelagibius sp. Alg239-R121 TaxID=2993448 RepID=UPI0024A68523|nr:XRE family transcriptional regulator [Pelagibius sp. Alg239-R121]
MKEVSPSDETDLAIGIALRALREEQGLSARNLALESGVSASMVSRIESGQVSPSISTLNALSRTLNVPLVSLFRETASDHTDFTHVKKGEGLRSTRIVGEHSHEYVNLSFHIRRDLQFEARLVTLHRQDARPPVYVGYGVVFVYVMEGEAVYGYGDREMTLKSGDSLSLDSELSHGFRKVLTEKFTFLTVQAERRR